MALALCKCLRPKIGVDKQHEVQKRAIEKLKTWGRSPFISGPRHSSPRTLITEARVPVVIFVRPAPAKYPYFFPLIPQPPCAARRSRRNWVCIGGGKCTFEGNERSEWRFMIFPIRTQKFPNAKRYEQSAYNKNKQKPKPEAAVVCS